MISFVRIAMSTVVALFCTVGCLTHSSHSAERAASAPTRSAAPPAAKATRPTPRQWTPDRVRAFVLKAHTDTQDLRRELLLPRFMRNEPVRDMGTCFGDNAAVALAKTSVIVPRLREYLTGLALQCYLSTYFGCTIGDWVAYAGMAAEGAPDMVPFTRSKVTILEETRDRVVADVIEADALDVTLNGILRLPEPELVDPNEPDRKYSAEERRAIEASRDVSEAQMAEYKQKSRYTLSRDSAGVWRISDRQPTWQWECRPR